MGKAVEPPYTIKQRVDITLTASEVEHAIRCWTLKSGVPQAKSFSDIVVRVFASDEGLLIDATLTYEPADQDQPA